jgi:ribosomal protein S12 methylthiotransferase RimO
VAYAAQVGTARVALITLGCARNEVDSEELAGRLAGAGFELVDDAEDADAVLVNTCGFIEAAKRESLDVIMSVAGETSSGRHRSVVAVGCMAERYGTELAAELPEADAVLGFDAYPDIAERLRVVMAGGHVASHVPRDRRELLPLTPVDRQAAAGGATHVPGHGDRAGEVQLPGYGHGWIRRRIAGGPVASLKIASGCDRRCAFCAIPSFRGAFVSRPSADLVAEAGWLADQGVRELVLVSENSTSYGKDLADPRALEVLLGQLAGVPGIDRIRVSYLQPAEVRPGLLATMIGTPSVADHFDLSFQHASAPLLRRMRRFGGTQSFLELIDRIRRESPRAGIRSNVIVGFPGESEADLAELMEFIAAAQMDAVGVFGYSDEEGTEAAGLPGHLDDAEIRARVDEVASQVDEVMAQRAQDRVGDVVEVLLESVGGSTAGAHESGARAEGRAEHQGPEDGSTTVLLPADLVDRVRPGSLVRARILSSDGVDLTAGEVSVVRS